MRDTVPPSSDSSGPNEAAGLVPFAHQKWTLDTIKIHYDSRLADMQRYYSDLISVQEQTNRDRFTSAEKSVAVARQADQEAIKVLALSFEKRMDTTNEWRGALEDQAKGKATITQFDTLKERVESLEKKLDAMLNKVLGIGVLITFIVAGIAIFSGLAKQ